MRMGRMSRVLGLWAAVLLALIAVTAALPGPYAGFALEDVRRPVYRGNVRYKRFFNNFSVNKNSENRFIHNQIYLNSISRQKRDSNISVSARSTANSTLSNRNAKKISSYNSVDYEENWSLISLATSISNQNHTRNIVKNFLTNSLQHLQRVPTPQPIVDPLRRTSTMKGEESLDHLILSHTQHGTKPIQMYPEGSPPNWHSDTLKPSVILIEDVHPSKLPKPTQSSSIDSDKYWVQHNNMINKPPHHYKPVLLSPLDGQKRPKPTITTVHNWDIISSVSENFHHKPQEVHSETGNLQPILVYPRPTTTSKPKPIYVMKPLNEHSGSVVGQSSYHPNVSPNHYPSNNHWNDQPTYKPPYNLVRPTRPTYHDPSVETESPAPKPDYRPVYTFPRPTKPSVTKPSHSSSPRPPEVHYNDPPYTSQRPSVIVSQATVLPVTEPAKRPPAPAIIVIDSDFSTPPPPAPDCGNVQVFNHYSKEPYKECSDVMILVNSPILNSASSSAVAGGIGSAVPAAVGAITPITNSVVLAAVPAAAAGSGAAVAAAAAGGAAAAAGAAGSAGAAAAGSAGAAAAAAAAAAGAGAAGSGGSGAPPHTYPVAKPPHVTPVLHPLDDEEDYDYGDDEDTTTSAPMTTTKPTVKPPTSHVTTFLDYFIAFVNTLPILGPVTVSLWIILLGPLAFILVGIMGVGTFLLPWVAPRIILGRRRRSITRPYPNIIESAEIFEKKLKLGFLNT